MPKPSRQVTLAQCEEISKRCINFRVRKISRMVGAVYDEALRPSGLRGTQFNLLVALALAKKTTVKRLAAILGVERTTLTRAISLLERDGLLRSLASPDGRERPLELTERGFERLALATAHWERAQAHVTKKLGQAQAAQLQDTLHSVMTRLAAR
jgi:DNA-binding MarR family transcriptional regulator